MHNEQIEQVQFLSILFLFQYLATARTNVLQDVWAELVTVTDPDC